MRSTYLLLAFLSVQMVAHVDGTLNEDLSLLISSTKVELAHSFFKRRVEKKNVAKLKITEERNGEINFTGVERSAALFRRSNDNFIFNGSQVLQLRKNALEELGNADSYLLDSVHNFPIEEGAIAFQQTEWNNIFFLAVCFHRNYCRALISNPATGFAFQQRLMIQTTPTDIEFFVDDEALFLIVAGDPCKIYRWTGAYFDEYDELETSGAVAVTTFRNVDNIVIVVAQNLRLKEVYSKVFIRRNKKTELIQMLQTKEASDVVSYSLHSGNESNSFVFVLSNREESTVFWWNGREFSMWKRVRSIIGPGRIYLHRVRSEHFLLFAHQNKLSVYHPTEISFDLVHSLEMDEDILDVDMREEGESTPMLLLLRASGLESLLTITLISIDVNYIPLADNQAVIDPVLQCLFQLKNLLDDRDSKFNESMFLSNEIGKKSGVMELERLTIPRLELKSFTINKLKVNPFQEKLQATSTEIRNELRKLKEEYIFLAPKVDLLLKQARYRFHGDILVGRMTASTIYANKFNERSFDLNNILTVTKNQTLSGAIRLKTLSAKALTLPSINGVYVKDLLQREKSLQEIIGEHTVRSIKAGNVVFGKLGKLNGTLFSGIEGFHNEAVTTISQRKTLPRATLRNLLVDYINNEPAEQWLAKIVPSTRDFQPEETLNFTQLKVTDLTVSNVNGMAWNSYLRALQRSAWNDVYTEGKEVSVGKAKNVHQLKTKMINGIETNYFLTKETPQKVDSTIKAGSATFHQVKADIFTVDTSFSTRHEGNQSSKLLLPAHLAVSQIIFTKPANVSTKIIHFDNIKNIYWMKNWPQELKTSLKFPHQVTIKNLKIMRINEEFVDKFVSPDELKTPKCRLIFENAKVLGKMVISVAEAHRNVNLMKLYDSAVKSQGENRVKGRKIFLGNVLSTNGLSLELLRNSIVEQHSLPMPDTGIFEAEIVGNVSVKNGLELKYLNGGNFNDIITDHVRIDEENILQKATFLSLSVKESEMENVNGIGKRLKIGNKRKKVRMVIKGDLKADKINVNTVNGILLDHHLSKVVLRNGTASTVKGRKQFERVVTVKGNLDGALNGYNLPELEKIAVSKSKAQKITGKFIVDVLNVNSADVEVIDGVFCENFIFEDESTLQAIESDILLADVAVGGNIKTHDFMDGCDLTKMDRIKVNEMRKVGKVDVMGNVLWRKDRREQNTISYLYGNSVTKQDDQIIEGSIVFRGNIHLDKLTTVNNINGIDLHFIAEDGIFRSLPVQEIFHDVTFRGQVTVNNILVENNVIVDNINGIDILDLEQRLVRNNAETEVRGKKKFLAGVSTLRLTAEAVNEAQTDAIIFCEGGPANESHSFPATTFHQVKSLRDLNVVRVNGVNLSNLLRERLSKKETQKVEANLLIKGNLSIKGDSGVSRINGLNVQDTILINGETDPKSITGKMEFSSKLSGAENLKVGKLNGDDLTEVKKRALVNNRDSLIKGNIIFQEEVELVRNLETLHGVSTCETKNIKPMQLPMKIGDVETNFKGKIDSEINELETSFRFLKKPVVLINLQAKANINVGLFQYETITHRYGNNGNNVEFDFYGFDNSEYCQLNKEECNCIAHKNVVISYPSSSPSFSLSSVRTVFEKNYKYVDQRLNIQVNVTVSTLSKNFRCEEGIDRGGEYATVNWMRLRRNSSDERKEMEKEEEKRYSANFTGNISDVKFFTIGESIFILMAFYIRPLETRINGLNTVVHELDSNRVILRKIQEIEMKGVEKINLFWTPKGVVLVAGNGYDSDIFADSVDSAIYRFSDAEYQFHLLRSVKTHGILDMASIRLEKESFIFLVQKQSWPFLVLKYNQEYDNYYFCQRLYADQSRSKSNFLSAAAFTTARPGYNGDVFVAIVHSAGVFHIYRYKHIEGFVEEIRQEQKNVEMIMPFRLNSRQYLMAASSGNHSVIYELVEQG